MQAANVTPIKTDGSRTVGTTQDRIRSFVERIERVEGEIEGLKDDHKEIYKELKGEGFDGAVIRKLVALRKKDSAELAERAEILRLYAQSTGDDQIAFLF